MRTARSLTEGAGAVKSVAADAVEPANEGALVHVTSAVVTDAPVADPEFDVEAQAVKLIRTVEMYQWKEDEKSETRKKLGGGTETVTTYTYDTAWSSDLEDSSQFQETAGHENPGSMPYDSTTTVADPVHLGAFVLSPTFLRSFLRLLFCVWPMKLGHFFRAASDGLLEGFDLFFREFADCASRQIGESHWSNGDALQPLHLVANAGQQPANLTVAAFVENHLKERGVFSATLDAHVFNVRETLGEMDPLVQLGQDSALDLAGDFAGALDHDDALQAGPIVSFL